ncbi:MAG: penicillin-binding protein 2 [Candidatus Kappaea frigidicola]|nr:penicillin-binding protein 2 [Candidatus Kappaea frigidicola]
MKVRNLKIVLSLLFLIVAIGLFRLQVLNYQYYNSLSKENRIRINPIVASRGDIYDRNGNILAKSRLSFNLAVIPQEAKKNETLLADLSSVVGISERKLRSNLERNTINYFVPAIIAEDIPRDQALYIEENNLDYSGVLIQTAPLREYLYEESLAHILGYVSKLNAQEYKRLKYYGYKSIDLVGRAGIESSYNSYLKGEDGGFQMEVDNRGRRLRLIGYKKPQKGKDIFLSIDLDLQNYIYSLIKDKKGAVCVWNPSDGKILAMVSAPSYNPNIFINPNSQKNKEIRAIFNTPPENSPLLNRNIQAVYPSGSVFKIVTLMSGLETEAINRKSEFNCPGYLRLGKKEFKCWYRNGHGNQNVVLALKNSCNVFCYRVGLKVGIDNLSSYARKFGYGVRTGIDLPSEQAGLVPDRHWKQKLYNDRWYDGDTVSLAIGQSYLQVTPLQILKMASVIANGGYLVTPTLVNQIEDVDVGVGKIESCNFKTDNLNAINEGMDLVVSETGTGKRAQVKGINIAGKTATVQNSHGKTHAGFVCFFPVDFPMYAIVVFIEHGGSGGYEAAGIAQKIIFHMKEESII